MRQPPRPRKRPPVKRALSSSFACCTEHIPDESGQVVTSEVESVEVAPQVIQPVELSFLKPVTPELHTVAENELQLE